MCARWNEAWKNFYPNRSHRYGTNGGFFVLHYFWNHLIFLTREPKCATIVCVCVCVPTSIRPLSAHIAPRHHTPTPRILGQSRRLTGTMCVRVSMLMTSLDVHHPSYLRSRRSTHICSEFNVGTVAAENFQALKFSSLFGLSIGFEFCPMFNCAEWFFYLLRFSASFRFRSIRNIFIGVVQWQKHRPQQMVAFFFQCVLIFAFLRAKHVCARN